MKTLHLNLLVLLLLSSCTVSNKVISEVSQFDASQVELIESGSEDEALRIWKITSYEDSLLLRKTSEDIDFDRDKELVKTFVKRLHATVTDPKAAGVGIAAPQVGILKNIIWVQRFDKENFPWEVFINPKILQYSKKKQPCPEGCLSIPEKNATTQNRAYAILLEYYNMEGEKQTEMVEAFTAVIFQHEIDHLNGILFIDHLEAELKE